VTLWYRWALGLWEEHGNTFGILGVHTVLDAWGPTDARWPELAGRLAERLRDKLCTPPGLVLLALGLGLARLGRGRLFALWALGFAVQVLLVPGGNLGHDYYQLQLGFVTAAYMGVGAELLWFRGAWTRLLLALVAAAGLVSSAGHLRDMMRVRQRLLPHVEMGRRIQEVTPPGDLVVFVVVREFEDVKLADYRHRTAQGERLYSDPTDLYLSRRKGFSLDDAQATPEFVEELRRRGARWLATAEPELADLGGPGVLRRRPELRRALARYRAVEPGDDFAIWELVPPVQPGGGSPPADG
jgi:hypothetical protein